MINLIPYKIDIITIRDEYVSAHTRLEEINKNVEKLKAEAESISAVLGSIRERETKLIDKIEAETGTKPSASDFIKIMKPNGSNS